MASSPKASRGGTGGPLRDRADEKRRHEKVRVRKVSAMEGGWWLVLRGEQGFLNFGGLSVAKEEDLDVSQTVDNLHTVIIRISPIAWDSSIGR